MVPHLQALEHHPKNIHYDGQPSRNVYRTDGFYRTADKIFYTRTCRFPHPRIVLPDRHMTTKTEEKTPI